ncbi:MAG: putative competence protein ComA [Pseudomonadota bacterium]|jgi:competence protein ComEC
MGRRSPLTWALAPCVVGAVLVLQTSARLPPEGLRAAAGLAALALIVTAACCAARAPRAAAWGVVLAVSAAAWTGAAWRAAERLEDRLSPDLEGRWLVVRGVVDELPVALPQGQGWRFGITVEACEATGEGGRAGAAGRRGEGGAGRGEADAGEVEAAAGGGRSEPPAVECRLPKRMMLSWSSGGRRAAAAPPERLVPGQRWSLTLRAKRPHAPVNFGAFDRELRWLQEGIGAIGTVRHGHLVDERVAAPAALAERMRTAARDALREAAGSERAREAGVLAALAVGDQAAIAPADWTTFNRTGVGHLMSISGLHVTMVGGLGGLLVGWLWRRRVLAPLALGLRLPAPQARRLATVAVAFGYAAIAGWGIPAQRTCFMLAAAMVLRAGARTASAVAAIGTAAVAIVWIDPWAPLAAGFWLSFGAVAAIVWGDAGMRPDRGRLARTLGGAVRTQWAATVSLLPLGAWFFASVSVVGPLANAIAIPLVGAVVTPVALAGTLVALASPAAAAWLVEPACTLVAALFAGLELLAGLPGAAFALPRPGLVALAVGCAGAMLLLGPRGLPGRARGALALLPIVAVPLPRPADGELRLTALDVGQGTAAVVQVGTRTLVYDAGPAAGQQTDAGARTVVPWLQSVGVSRPDVLVVSHLDDDHSGGALSLLRALPPERLVSSLPDGHAIVAAAARADRCRRGEGWVWGDAAFDWLHPADPPEAARRSPSNALSCVLRVRHPAGTLLLAGDIEASQERTLVSLFGRDGLAADVLLVPHHGSRTSSTEAFVDAVAPRWAVVQAAYRSRFGHPHPAVVERYDRRGIALLRSDADGAVQLRMHADGAVRVLRARHDPARYWRVAVPP